MFVLTARVSRGKLMLGILALAALVAALVLLFAEKDTAPAAETAAVRPVTERKISTNEERVAWLVSQGWLVEAEPIESKSVVIPREFSDVYAAYNELQKTQGFDLTPYAGREATRYTYAVKNHPSGGEVVADLIVCKGKIIAGDVQSAALDGFMEPLVGNESAGTGK
ncbi:MAG: DUF4830 domain-containing protein [bacterium]